MTTSPTDPTMARIIDAVTEFRSGDPESARAALLALWSEIGVAGDPLHRCTLAHYLADAYDDPAEALVWDVRALDAADALTDTRLRDHNAGLQVAGFYPSLHLNLADNFRRLGAFPAATRHLDAARDRLSILPDDEYGTLIRTAVTELAAMIAAHDTTRRPTH
ncbi:hypothetical protein NN3_25510 [Nocardia neocaledoniensis NBRC 108232]|uniref:Tetratricopeptide repeat protein n=1 Tax=Nocardia neocaledoniensis TaxID=236511 RepID=A0A317N3I7_9NOCA|nr:hypothetical protein [Nocardia neocaledoniensis]PWV68803.1 hypothetical protein DFR69_117122 [Nocardia neocaledoniensis]GEM31544.1 hypothetical protein NN3_25510 [Nocardia neocaledoniensis NBRC 108232]